MSEAKLSQAKLSQARLREARLRQAAVMLTLAFGVPLVLAWFGLLGWGVVWLARSALSL
ncbi:pentapeptide repeat-containing protein [Methylobacterium terrae]|uniref:pentapeptide repeat-containing protein n=1 Tax=Methylobacterium terrae TaxID=2202827 RepID=UPI001ABFC0B2|nr:pentapeptide repeat-containing protein [Methylobacterium terrae]